MSSESLLRDCARDKFHQYYYYYYYYHHTNTSKAALKVSWPDCFEHSLMHHPHTFSILSMSC